MKIEKISNRLTSGILGALAAFGGIGCMVTGLHFDTVSMAAVAVFCALTAAVCSATAERKLFPILPGLVGFACLWLWLKGTLALSVEALVNHISYLYDLGYGWGVVRWSREHLSLNMAQQALCILGILIAMGVTWSLLRRKGILLAAALVCLPVVPCMILTDTIPAAPYLFIQLLCLILLLLTRLVRKQGQDMDLLKWLALPVTAALFVLFLAMPQAEFTSLKHLDSILGNVQGHFTDSSQEGPNVPVKQESDWIDLSSVGPKDNSDTPVMEVLTQQTGYLYLKGAAYDTYQGTWWGSEGFTAHQPPSANRILSVLVTTKALHDVLFLPYGAYSIPSADVADRITETDGRVDNPSRLHSYAVRYTGAPDYAESWQQPANHLPQQFTLLPADTLVGAREYLSRALPELDAMDGVWDKAKAIADHVSHSARYNLQAAPMPQTGNDFALWFLEESDTGYCIHFASATTVLLRAAGIPARYVTGYLVDARAGKTAQVTQADAHAWAECYINGIGWMPLEATPGYDASHTGESETTVPTEETTEETTQETTQPTTAPGQSETGPSTAPTLPSDAEHTSPVGGADGPGQKQPWTMPPWLKWILGILCAIGAVVVQWRLRVSLRQKWRYRGRRNAQVLKRWREVMLHCRVRRIAPDDRLYELAQKARFSHHLVTREELTEFDQWLKFSKVMIQQLSLFKRFLATVLLALY